MGRGFPVVSSPLRSPRYPSTAGGTEATGVRGSFCGEVSLLIVNQIVGAREPTLQADLGVLGQF